MNFCKSLCFSLLFALIFSAAAFSQQRPRIVSPPTAESQPINQPPIQTQIIRRPTLTNQISVQPPPSSLIKKTGSSQPLNAPANATFNKNYYNATFSSRNAVVNPVENRHSVSIWFDGTENV